MNIVACNSCGALYDADRLEKVGSPSVYFSSGEAETYAKCKVCDDHSVFLRDSTDEDLENTGDQGMFGYDGNRNVETSDSWSGGR